jgi:hypothetical protein
MCLAIGGGVIKWQALFKRAFKITHVIVCICERVWIRTAT